MGAFSLRTMAYLSRSNYTGNGSTDLYQVTFPYLSKAHVEVYANGGKLTEGVGYTWINAGYIKLSAVLGTGIPLLIKRNTPKEGRLVNFQDASVLTEADLDLDSDQVFYTVQEDIDERQGVLFIGVDNSVDMAGARIKNIGVPRDGADAVTKDYADTVLPGYVSAAATSAATAAAAANRATTEADGATSSATSAAESAALAELAASTITPVGVQLHAAAAKSSPEDSDEIGLADSSSSFGLKKFSWANLKAALSSVAFTWSSKHIFNATVKMQQALEKITITGTAPVANFDCLTQGVQYFTSIATANWALNFRGDSTRSLDSIMAVGECLTVSLLATQGTTGYLPTTFQVDGAAVTPKYAGGTAWTADASVINAFSFTLIKTAPSTFTVLASKSKYA